MAEEIRCCICDEPLSPPYNLLGQRAYCARHFAAVNKTHAGFWRAGLAQLVGMTVFSAVVAGLGSALGDVTTSGRMALGIFLAIVPALLWMTYFYQQDRLEPEPKERMALVFFLALALFDVFGRRLIDEVFKVNTWAAYDTNTSLLANMLINGVIYQACMYLAVRFGVYASPEFDERMDGIVYGTVAGLGVATMLNLRYILDNNGVAVTPGVIQTVTMALAQASFGGLMGWFMAEAKFTHKGALWVPLGFAVSALLNGFFTWLTREVSSSGLSVDPFRQLGLGTLVAVAMLGLMVLLMRRSARATLTR